MHHTLEPQYLRTILLVNNPVAAGLAFARAAQHWPGDTFWAMGTFFVVSFVMNYSLLIYTMVQLRRARTQGYISFAPPMDELQSMHIGIPEQPQMGKRLFSITLLSDISLSIAFVVLATIGLITSHQAGGAVASIGAVTAAVVHLSYTIMCIPFSVLFRYKVKVSLVRRDARWSSPKHRRQFMVKAKEQCNPTRPVGQEAVTEQGYGYESEALSARPYRGSPSNKPTHMRQPLTDSPVGLSEATEADRLIADCD